MKQFIFLPTCCFISIMFFTVNASSTRNLTQKKPTSTAAQTRTARQQPQPSPQASSAITVPAMPLSPAITATKSLDSKQSTLVEKIINHFELLYKYLTNAKDFKPSEINFWLDQILASAKKVNIAQLAQQNTIFPASLINAYYDACLNPQKGLIDWLLKAYKSLAIGRGGQYKTMMLYALGQLQALGKLTASFLATIDMFKQINITKQIDGPLSPILQKRVSEGTSRLDTTQEQRSQLQKLHEFVEVQEKRVTAVNTIINTTMDLITKAGKASTINAAADIARDLEDNATKLQRLEKAQLLRIYPLTIDTAQNIDNLVDYWIPYLAEWYENFKDEIQKQKSTAEATKILDGTLKAVDATLNIINIIDGQPIINGTAITLDPDLKDNSQVRRDIQSLYETVKTTKPTTQATTAEKKSITKKEPQTTQRVSRRKKDI